MLVNTGNGLLVILSNRISSFVGLCVATLLVAPSAYAAEYYVESKIGVSANHDDNARLSSLSSQEVSLTGRSIQPEVILGVNTETVESNLEIILDFQAYNVEEWDTDNQDVKYLLTKRLEKHTFSFNAGLLRDTTRTSEFSSSGIATADRHERFTSGFVWDYFPTNRVFSRVNLNWSKDKYNDPFDRFSDYETYSASLLGDYQINEKFSVNLLGSYAETEFNKIDQVVFYTDGTPIGILTPLQTAIPKMEQNTLRLGAKYGFNETLSLDASLGKTNNKRSWDVLRTDFTNAGLGSSGIVEGDAVCQPGFLNETPSLTRDLCSKSSSKTDSRDISLTKKWRKGNGVISYNEFASPSSDGTLFNGKTLSLTWDYRLDEKQSLSGRFQYGENETIYRVAAINNINDRKYSRIMVTHLYKFLENWQIRSSYTYREQKYDRTVNLGKARSNYFSFGIVYIPNKLSWSR